MSTVMGRSYPSMLLSQYTCLKGMVYLGACLIAGIRLARERQVNVRVIPTRHAVDESVELAHEIFNRVFRRVPTRIQPR